MMKQEFEKLIHAEVSESDYNVIDYVYTWYPTVSETEGKNQIAELYVSFGMAIITDMVPRARKMEDLENELRAIQQKLITIQDQIKKLRGDNL
ncbi:MAG: hypothetical protein F8N38_01095 [Hungatella sp.]|nr:hypothetical protein [Hungatella sp.]